jgi:hypothetical protein
MQREGDESFVSFGGAGFLHPMEASARMGYQQGDTVSCWVDFQAEMVCFAVNGEFVGEEAWKHPEAFPAISIDRSHLNMDSIFEVTTSTGSS